MPRDRRYEHARVGYPVTGEIVSEKTEGLDGVLSDAAARRLSNQLARAYRGTYGAEVGLRMIVRSVARQMIQAGSSPESVSRTFERYVLDHPSFSGVDPRIVLTGRVNSRTLIELTQQCVADATGDTRGYNAPS